MVRILVALLIIALIALQVQMWQQYSEVRDLRNAVTAQEEQNLSLYKRNLELAAEVDDLRAGQEAIEERARSELGLIGEGEQFIQIIDSPLSAEDATISNRNNTEQGNEQP